VHHGPARSRPTPRVNIGYRYFAATDQTPLYPFGYGLSYTDFEYKGLKVSRASDRGLDVKVTVTNTGTVDGDAVPQVYLGAPETAVSGVQFAPTALAAFDRVSLEAGESRELTIHVRPRQLQYWASDDDQWVTALGKRSVSVNSSATSPVLTTRVTINQAAPAATKAPAISGTPVVGRRLTASAGTWDVTGVATSHQWLRNGSPIAGATAATYALTPADAGAKVSVRVTAAKAGYDNGSATSPSVNVAKASTSTTVSAKPKRVKVGKKVTVRVSVKATGISPAGTVTVRRDGQVVAARVALRSGNAVVKVAIRGKGRHTISVAYNPGAGFTASSGQASVTARR
jgi:hypothetical protein